MTALRILYLAGALFCVTFAPGNCITTYYMDDHCGSKFYMFEGSILLDLTSAYQYDPDMKCVFSVQSNKKYMDRIMIKVLSIGTEDGLLCENDRLIINDGRSTSYRKLTGRYGICGHTPPYNTYKTSGDWVTFNFTSDSSVQGTGFQLLLTGFDDSGICISSEYECSNGYCVDDDLECDGYDNCGDDSDESFCTLSVGAIVGISVGCAVGAVVLAGIIIALAANRRRTITTTARCVTTDRSYLSGQPYTVYGSPIAGQGTMPPPYATLYNTQYPPQGQAAGQVGLAGVPATQTKQ